MSFWLPVALPAKPLLILVSPPWLTPIFPPHAAFEKNLYEPITNETLEMIDKLSQDSTGKTNGIQWDPMGSNGIQWDPMGMTYVSQIFHEVDLMAHSLLKQSQRGNAGSYAPDRSYPTYKPGSGKTKRGINCEQINLRLWTHGIAHQ